MDDFLKEEMDIMREQSEDNMVLTADTFKHTIEDMGFSKPYSLPETALLGEVVKLMQEKYIGCVLLTNGEKISGIFTERDFLFRVGGKISDWEKTPVNKVMTKDPLTLWKTDVVAYVMNNMHVRNFRHIPIVDETSRPIGVVSIKDVMSYILDHCPEHVTNITGEPFRGKTTREGA